MAKSNEHANEGIWDSAAAGWAKWESALMNATTEATERMLDAAHVKEGMVVLDLACGAGSQTIKAAQLVGPSGRVVANDIASKMLSFVESNADLLGITNVDTLHGPAERLADSGLNVDAVTCRLGLMLFQSPHEALASARNILAQDGRIAALVFASPQENPFFSETMMIAMRHAGKSPPPAGSPGLFALSDPARLKDLFEAAGYSDVSVERVASRLAIASLEDTLTMMQEAFGAYRAVLADLDDTRREKAWAEIGTCLEKFLASDGGVNSDMVLLLVSGENPRT